jgi:transposase-like protein
VAEGMAMAQAYLRSGLGQAEFARQHGITLRMVKYWSGRARQLAVASESAAPAPCATPLLEHVGHVEAGGAVTIGADAPKTAAPVLRDPATIEVRLARGLTIAVTAGFSPVLLRQIVACLDGDHSC